MTFLHELAVRLTAAVAAGKTPDLENYLEQQKGEEVIGFVSDPQLLALIAMRDDQDGELVLQRRKSSWQTGPVKAMSQYIQFELQKWFASWEDEPLGLRRKGSRLAVVRFNKKGSPSPPIFFGHLRELFVALRRTKTAQTVGAVRSRAF